MTVPSMCSVLPVCRESCSAFYTRSLSQCTWAVVSLFEERGIWMASEHRAWECSRGSVSGSCVLSPQASCLEYRLSGNEMWLMRKWVLRRGSCMFSVTVRVKGLVGSQMLVSGFYILYSVGPVSRGWRLQDPSNESLLSPHFGFFICKVGIVTCPT